MDSICLNRDGLCYQVSLQSLLCPSERKGKSLEEGNGTCPASNRKSVACRFSDSPQFAQQPLDQSSSHETKFFKAMGVKRAMISQEVLYLLLYLLLLIFIPPLRVLFFSPFSVKNLKNCLILLVDRGGECSLKLFSVTECLFS